MRDLDEAAALLAATAPGPLPSPEEVELYTGRRGWPPEDGQCDMMTPASHPYEATVGWRRLDLGGGNLSDAEFADLLCPACGDTHQIARVPGEALPGQ